jgi:hypothetical protein
MIVTFMTLYCFVFHWQCDVSVEILVSQVCALDDNPVSSSTLKSVLCNSGERQFRTAAYTSCCHPQSNNSMKSAPGSEKTSRSRDAEEIASIF